jgi:hypothetical protein
MTKEDGPIIDKKMKSFASIGHRIKIVGEKANSLIIKPLVPTLIFALFLYILGRYVLCPSLDIKISKPEINILEFSTYEVTISNPTDLHYLESIFSF